MVIVYGVYARTISSHAKTINCFLPILFSLFLSPEHNTNDEPLNHERQNICALIFFFHTRHLKSCALRGGLCK